MNLNFHYKYGYLEHWIAETFKVFYEMLVRVSVLQKLYFKMSVPVRIPIRTGYRIGSYLPLNINPGLTDNVKPLN